MCAPVHHAEKVLFPVQFRGKLWFGPRQPWPSCFVLCRVPVCPGREWVGVGTERNANFFFLFFWAFRSFVSSAATEPTTLPFFARRRRPRVVPRPSSSASRLVSRIAKNSAIGQAGGLVESKTRNKTNKQNNAGRGTEEEAGPVRAQRLFAGSLRPLATRPLGCCCVGK